MSTWVTFLVGAGATFAFTSPGVSFLILLVAGALRSMPQYAGEKPQPLVHPNATADNAFFDMNPEDSRLETCETNALECEVKPEEPNKGMDLPPTTPKSQVGLLVTNELELALKHCKEKVALIAKECRAGNRKFRDIEFDLENDPIACQHGLYSDGSKAPPDVRRVSEIFENPKFFVDKPGSNDIAQGALGDCWFLSALSTMSTSAGLIEKLCIARDEEVGVYGFIFFRDNRWVDVIIDDQLFWSLPKFEELAKEEQELYHEDKDLYNSMARKGGKGLHYAKSGVAGETWVPLIEKAYAKLHGDFLSLTGGRMSEGIEDLTGGVSIMFNKGDILDPERFWNEELMQVNNKTHLFGVSFPGLDEVRSGDSSATVRGLYGAHAYSILRVKECRGKRFIVIRNPWGRSEWTGAWSDGSKEWTGEWLQVLKELDHVMGDDGEFVMEYSDFLETWTLIQRTIIFDASWMMSSHWMRVPPKPIDHAWTYGDVIFYFTLPKPSITLLVLSQLDDRYFKYLEGVSSQNLEFVVYKRGDVECKGESYAGTFCQRSVSCELDLEEGEYAVYPRIDRIPSSSLGYFDEGEKLWNSRKLSRVLTQRTQSRSIASNYDVGDRKKFIPTSLKSILEQNSETKKSNNDLLRKEDAEGDLDGTTITTTTSTTIVTTVQQRKTSTLSVKENALPPDTAASSSPATRPRIGDEHPVTTPQIDSSRGLNDGLCGVPELSAAEREATAKPGVSGDDENENPVFLGLRVYTKDVVVVITGRLRDSD